MAARFELKLFKNNKYFFTLKASNGQVIGPSQMFTGEAHRDSEIDLCKTNGPGAAVSDLTT